MPPSETRPQDTAQRRDEVLKRMLNTPPQPSITVALTLVF